MISSAILEKTKDEKDYKIVFKKSRRSAAALNPPEDGLETKKDTQSPNLPKSPNLDNQIVQQANDLVAYFYAVFYPEVKKNHFTSKAVAQAVSLIAIHGFDQARFTVEFSADAAPKTNYHPQTFGGVLQYTSRALARFEQMTKAEYRRALVGSCSFLQASAALEVTPSANALTILTLKVATHVQIQQYVRTAFPETLKTRL